MRGIQVDLTENNAIETNIVPRLVGVLVNEGLSAKQAINALDEAKEIYLDRSYHVASK